MRIMESDSKGVYLQTLTDESKASLDQAVQRMHLISHSMCEDVFNALKNNDISLAKSVFSLDDDVDQFCFFILRILRNAAQGPVLANELRIDPLIAWITNISFTNRACRGLRGGHSKTYHNDRWNRTKNSRVTCYSLWLMKAWKLLIYTLKRSTLSFQRDVNFSVEIMKQIKRIEKLDLEIANTTFMNGKKPELICAVCSIREDIKKIADYAANIAEITVNRAFKVTA